jgi:hypothetical protein
MSIEKQIRDTVERQGFAEADIVRQYIKPRAENLNQDGEWFCLFARYRERAPFQLWGRRRTLDELMQLAHRGPIS